MANGPRKMLTIAGSDILAGGGIQADLATFNEYGFFGLSVITSIVTVTADDFTIHPIAPEIVAEQLSSVFALHDIAAVKVGLLPSIAHVKLVADFLKRFATDIPVVIDPVMAFKETASVDVTALVTSIKTELLPLATVITPNLVEAQWLTGQAVTDELTLTQVAQRLKSLGAKNVVVKGGARLSGDVAIDVVVTPDEVRQLSGPKLAGAFNNGAGCTFASAIASQLADEVPVVAAVTDAKAFVADGIRDGVPLNEQIAVGNVWQAARRYRSNEQRGK